jgi:hypothetical protein
VVKFAFNGTLLLFGLNVYGNLQLLLRVFA